MLHSEVNWDTVHKVLMYIGLLVVVVDAYLTRGREDRRDDEVRLLKLQVANLQKLDKYSSKTLVQVAPTIQVQDSDLMFDPPASESYRRFFTSTPPVSK